MKKAKKAHRSTSEILAVLADAKATSPAKAMKKHKVSSAAFYTWRKKYKNISVKNVKFSVEMPEKNAPDIQQWKRPDGGKITLTKAQNQYTTGSIEVMSFIEDQEMDFHRARALQLVVKSQRQASDTYAAESIRRAIWYLERKAKQLEAE